MVAYHDNDVRQLLTDLGSFYERQLDPTAPPLPEAAPPASRLRPTATR